MKKSMMWRLSVAALVLVLCWTVSAQAGEGNDLSSEGMDTLQAQAAPAYNAMAPAAACSTNSYTMISAITNKFEDISATGTDLTLSLDTYAPVSLPFTFSYDCAAYTTIYVNDSGVINFANENQTFTNSCLPASPGTQPTFIAPFWDDLYPDNTGAQVLYEVKGTGPHRRLIVQWENLDRYLRDIDGIRRDQGNAPVA